MSHTVEAKIEIRNIEIMQKAAAQVGAEWIPCGDITLYDRKVRGYGAQLEGWHFPVVFKTNEDQSVTGEIVYDNFNGSWGRQEQLDELLQRYCIEQSRDEATRMGLTVTEEVIENDAVRLTCHVVEG